MPQRDCQQYLLASRTSMASHSARSTTRRGPPDSIYTLVDKTSAISAIRYQQVTRLPIRRTQKVRPLPRAMHTSLRRGCELHRGVINAHHPPGPAYHRSTTSPLGLLRSRCLKAFDLFAQRLVLTQQLLLIPRPLLCLANCLGKRLCSCTLFCAATRACRRACRSSVSSAS
jgi:hypothetical protein